MVYKTTFTERRLGVPGQPGQFRAAKRQAGFTLPEVMVASGVGVVAMLALMLLSLYSSRSFVAIANYVNMDERSQFALDKMAKEIRQARRLTSYSSTSLTLEGADSNPLLFVFDPEARNLIRVSGGVTNTYLTDCDSLQFSKYQGTAVSNSFDAYAPSYVTNTRLIQVSWVCSRKILGAKMNSESVQSAKIVIRNNPSL